MEIQEQVRDAEVENQEDAFGSAFAEDEGAASPEVKEDATPPEPEAKADEEVSEPEPEKKETPKAEAQPTLDEQIDWEKRAKDNQSAFTKSQMELAALRDEIAELKKKAETTPEKPEPKPESAPEVPEEVKTFLADYPELKPTVEFLAGQMVKDALGGVDLKQLAAERQRDQEYIGRLAWERDITNGFMDESGNFVEGHPDLHRVVANKDYLTWIKGKGYDNDCDAKTAIARITEYKEEVLKKSAAAHDASAKVDAEKLKETMAGSLHSKPAPRATGKKDEGSFSDGFRDN